MLSVANRITDVNAPLTVITVTYEDARLWIGRRLVLRKPLLGFKPGMPCVVMCVVDFGDGPLLWIVTDDNQQVEVDQMEVSCISDYFQLHQTEIYHRTG